MRTTLSQNHNSTVGNPAANLGQKYIRAEIAFCRSLINNPDYAKKVAHIEERLTTYQRLFRAICDAAYDPLDDRGRIGLDKISKRMGVGLSEFYFDGVTGYSAVSAFWSQTDNLSIDPSDHEADIYSCWQDVQARLAEQEAMRYQDSPLGERLEQWRTMVHRLESIYTPDESEDDRDDEFIPFPVDKLPNVIRDLISSGAKSIGCDSTFLALPMLTLIGGAVGNTYRLRLKRDWLVPPTLWAAVIGESGTAKTPAFQMVTKPAHIIQSKYLNEFDAVRASYDADLERWESQAAARRRGESDDPRPVQPYPVRCLVSDATVESIAPLLKQNPRGLTLIRDELSGFFGSFDKYSTRGKISGDASSWLSMYNGEPLIVDRKSPTAPVINVQSALVSICGGIQPGILQRVLTNEHRESGLAARFLFAYPPRPDEKQWHEDDGPGAWNTPLVEMLERLYSLEMETDEHEINRPKLVILTAEAKFEWLSYFREHAREQMGMTGDMAAVWSKLEETAARLARVCHFARYGSCDPSCKISHLDEESMIAGITLARWFKNEIRRVYRLLDGDNSAGDYGVRLLEWMRRTNTDITAREIVRNCRWIKKAPDAERQIEKLVVAGLIRLESDGSTSRGGRSTRRYEVVDETPGCRRNHPKISEDFEFRRLST